MIMNTINDYLSSINSSIGKILHVRLKILRMDIIDHATTAGAGLLYLLVAILLTAFALLFGFLSLGFLFAKLLDSLTLGFASVAGIYVLLLLILICFRKKFITTLTDLLLVILDPTLHGEDTAEEAEKRVEASLPPTPNETR
jgi:hypothetical protein